MRHSFALIHRFVVAGSALASGVVIAAGTSGCQAPQDGPKTDRTVTGDLDGDAADGPEARIPSKSDFEFAKAFDTLGFGEGAEGEPDTVAIAADADASAAPAGTEPESNEDHGGEIDGIAVSMDTGPDAARGVETASLEAIAEQLHRLAATADDPIPLELVSAMLLLAADDPDALAALPIAGEVRGQLMADEIETREAVADFARAVRLRAEGGEVFREALVAELTVLADRLRNEPGLRIGDADICSAIRGFGDVDRLPHRLPARVDRDVLVYVPVEGLDWIEDAATGKHRWRLRHRIELHQLADGLVIDPGSWSLIDHALPQPTQDTYFWIRYTIPGLDLASGRYALKLRIEETGAEPRQAERTIEIDLLPERLVSRE